MFDSSATIVVPFHSPLTPKVAVRFPKDEEWIEWRRKKKVIQKDMGRRTFQVEGSQPSQADLQLLQAIRLDKDSGAQYDEAEAYYVLTRLSECEVTERPDRDSAAYIIPMKVMRRFKTTHKLAIPSVKQMMEYERRRSSVVFGQYNNQEIRINFQAAADLYDVLIQEKGGYKGDVPVPHKAEAINVLLQELRGEQEDEQYDDEDNSQD